MKPDRAVFIVAGFTAADAGIAQLCGAPWWAAVVLVLLACAAVPLFWHAPPEPGQGGGLEALVEATREMTPRPMVTWAAADWAAREKELKELSEP